MTLSDIDRMHLRRCVELAREALEAGDQPFGSVLVGGDGQVLREELAWLPAQGLYFVLRVDGLAWVFSMLVLAIGLLVVLYARYYMSPADPVPRFFAFLLAFMGSMLGVVLSGNLVQLVVFWELTSLTSFLLIGYWHHRADARRGARMAFTVTATGGLCLMAGVLVLGNIVGSYDLDVVLAAGERIRADELYRPALVLIALRVSAPEAASAQGSGGQKWSTVTLLYMSDTRGKIEPCG